MAYKPLHIDLWYETINYEGKLFNEYYVAHWRFFRCSPRERSNHDFIHEHLEDSGAAPGHVQHIVFTDAAQGFRYYLMVHKDAEKALRMADMFAARIARKGSLDPDNERSVDRKSIRHSWRVCGVPMRVQLCKDAGVSVFASRKNDFPFRHADALYKVMSETDQ